MAEKKLQRIDPNQAPAQVRTQAAIKAMDEYHNDKKNWPLSKYEEQGRGNDAAVEAANEWAREANRAQTMQTVNKKKGGRVSSASKRADGIATKGKTRGRIV